MTGSEEAEIFTGICSVLLQLDTVLNTKFMGDQVIYFINKLVSHLKLDTLVYSENKYPSIHNVLAILCEGKGSLPCSQWFRSATLSYQRNMVVYYCL